MTRVKVKIYDSGVRKVIKDFEESEEAHAFAVKKMKSLKLKRQLEYDALLDYYFLAEWQMELNRVVTIDIEEL